MNGIEASFSSAGVEIAYLDAPADRDAAPERLPVLLIHGFASNYRVNWVDTSWVRHLRQAGHRVIAFDVRGHGRSDKLYDETLYGAPIFADDAFRLLEHLGIERAHVQGFSMGARIAAFLALEHPERVASVVFSGLGANMVLGLPGARAIAHAFLAEDPAEVTHPTARSFRDFAVSTGSDLRALAACILSARARITAEMVGALRVPTLVAVGTDDPIGGPAKGLADLIPGAEHFDIVGRDHMKSVGDRTHKQAVTAFFARHEPRASAG
ncbi:MAG: alpha/beta fold hydrolase [Rhizobiales bacterium]|nr:alpha/beta fold hydrolase [Hyphomicrobiales bacterium]